MVSELACLVCVSVTTTLFEQVRSTWGFNSDEIPWRAHVTDFALSRKVLHELVLLT